MKPNPSERQPKETTPAFEAFRCYLEMGPSRSLHRVAQALSKSDTLIKRWSSQWKWVQRVREFESRETAVKDDAHMDALAKRSQRQAEIAQLHGEATALVAREVVKRVQKAQQTGKDPFEGLTDEELLRIEASMARAHNRVVSTERLALGLTTDQPGEPLPRSVAEEQARRLTTAELDARLAGVDEVAERRARKRAARAAAR